MSIKKKLRKPTEEDLELQVIYAAKAYIRSILLAKGTSLEGDLSRGLKALAELTDAVGELERYGL
jgi:hypothetical protein